MEARLQSSDDITVEHTTRLQAIPAALAFGVKEESFAGVPPIHYSMSDLRLPATPRLVIAVGTFCTTAWAAAHLASPASESADLVVIILARASLVALAGGCLLWLANRGAAKGAAALRATIADLQVKNAELERRNRELDDFTSVAAHDLKEPLHGIGAYCGLLLEQNHHQLDDDGRRKMETMASLCDRLTKLIDDLLGYCRAGRQAEMADVDMADVLEGVLATIGPAIEARRGIVRCVGPLPRVRADATLLAGVLQNLISNGLKFNDRPTPLVEIRWVESDAGHGQAATSPANGSNAYRRIDRVPAAPPLATIAVRDNGIGIEPRHHEAVFAMFRRLHHQRKYAGTGAGLAIVRKIIEHHGGRIWLESTPGEGTTFFFTLPAVEAASVSVRASAAVVC